MTLSQRVWWDLKVTSIRRGEFISLDATSKQVSVLVGYSHRRLAGAAGPRVHLAKPRNLLHSTITNMSRVTVHPCL
jgi:hypothetical protein